MKYYHSLLALMALLTTLPAFGQTQRMQKFDSKLPVVEIRAIAGITGDPKDPAARREFARAKACLARVEKVKVKGLKIRGEAIEKPEKFEEEALKSLRQIAAFADLKLDGALVVVLDQDGYTMGCFVKGWHNTRGFYRELYYLASKWYGKNPTLLIKDIKGCIPAYRKTTDRDYVNAAILLLRTEQWVDGVLKDMEEDPEGDGRLSKREAARWKAYKEETDKLRKLVLAGLEETVGEGMIWSAKGWRPDPNAKKEKEEKAEKKD